MAGVVFFKLAVAYTLTFFFHVEGDICNIQPNCSSVCAKSCVACESYSSYCILCEPHWSGSHCTIPCSKRCMRQLCDIVGFCQEGCRQGFYGLFCEKSKEVRLPTRGRSTMKVFALSAVSTVTIGALVLACIIKRCFPNAWILFSCNEKTPPEREAIELSSITPTILNSNGSVSEAAKRRWFDGAAHNSSFGTCQRDEYITPTGVENISAMANEVSNPSPRKRSKIFDTSDSYLTAIDRASVAGHLADLTYRSSAGRVSLHIYEEIDASATGIEGAPV